MQVDADPKHQWVIETIVKQALANVFPHLKPNELSALASDGPFVALTVEVHLGMTSPERLETQRYRDHLLNVTTLIRSKVLCNNCDSCAKILKAYIANVRSQLAQPHGLTSSVALTAP